MGPPEDEIIVSHSATPAGRKPMGPPKDEIIVSHSATPAGRSTRPECGWYTPADYWDEIRPASTNGGAVGGEGRVESDVKRESSTTYFPVDESWRESRLRGSVNRYCAEATLIAMSPATTMRG